MEILEYNLCERVIFEEKLKNFEIYGFLKIQNTTRATFLRCGTPRRGTPRRGTPRRGTPRRGTPRRGTHRRGTPRRGTP